MENLKKVNGYYVDKKRLGQRIFDIRKNRNDTLEEFGKMFNASKGNVLNWENGSSVPNRARIEKLAKKGGITVNELLYGSIEEFIDNNIKIISEKYQLNINHFDKNEINNLIDDIVKYSYNNNLTINNIDDIVSEIKDTLPQKSINWNTVLFTEKIKEIQDETLQDLLQLSGMLTESDKKEIIYKIIDILKGYEYANGFGLPMLSKYIDKYLLNK